MANDNKAAIIKTVGSQMAREATLCMNVGQEIIVLPADRLRLRLNDHLHGVAKKQSWITPILLFLSILTTLTTTHFTDAFYIPANSWKTCWVLAAIASALWSAKAIWISIRTKATIETLIVNIKADTVITTIQDRSSTPT